MLVLIQGKSHVDLMQKAFKERSSMTQDNKSRRIFLQALSACLASSVVPLSAASATGRPTDVVLDDFLQAASELTGLKLTNRDLAVTYLGVLQARFKPGDIDSLLAAAHLGAQEFSSVAARPPLKDIAEKAMFLWLTGMTIDPANGAPQVLAYSEAAVWDALPFTKPPGQCGGAFGYWSQAPSPI